MGVEAIQLVPSEMIIFPEVADESGKVVVEAIQLVPSLLMNLFAVAAASGKVVVDNT